MGTYYSYGGVQAKKNPFYVKVITSKIHHYNQISTAVVKMYIIIRISHRHDQSSVASSSQTALHTSYLTLDLGLLELILGTHCSFIIIWLLQDMSWYHWHIYRDLYKQCDAMRLPVFFFPARKGFRLSAFDALQTSTVKLALKTTCI